MKKLIVASLVVCIASISAWSQTQLKKYEYWIDNDYSNRVQQSFSPVTTFDLTTLADFLQAREGLHTINVRFQDTQGNWSYVHSRYVYKVAISQYPTITAFEYWFDGETDQRYSEIISPTDVLEKEHTLDVSHLTDGLHLIQMRYRDNYDRWGQIVWRFFLKQSAPTEQALIARYRYWINEDKTTLKTKELIAPVKIAQVESVLQMEDIPVGIHNIYFQFQDTKGEWSSPMATRFEMVDCHPAKAETPFGAEEVCHGSLQDYYWTTGAYNADGHIWMIEPEEAGTLHMENKKVTVVWEPTFVGEAKVYVKGTNICGEGEISDPITITVIPVPEAPAKPVGDKDMCINPSNSVYSVAEVEYSEEYKWELEPSSSGIITPKNNGLTAEVDWKLGYTGEVSIRVAGRNQCGTAEYSEVFTANIHPVPDKPEITTDDNLQFCAGGQIQLNGPEGEGFQYLWSTDAIAPSITVTESGNYTLIIVDQYGCVSPPSDALYAEAYDLPVKPTISQDGLWMVSNYQQGNQWYSGDNLVDGATERRYLPPAYGIYKVKITDAQGCQNISDPYNYMGLGAAQLRNGKLVKLFPNPNDGTFQLNIPEALRSVPQLKVRDMKGSEVPAAVKYSARTFDIQLVDAPKGQYFLELTVDNEKVALPFIVK